MIQLFTPAPWTEQALCAQSDPDAWFPEVAGKGSFAAAHMAKRICFTCPVQRECLELALSGADSYDGTAHGIWGGTTPLERRELRLGRRTIDSVLSQTETEEPDGSEAA